MQVGLGVGGGEADSKSNLLFCRKVAEKKNREGFCLRILISLFYHIDCRPKITLPPPPGNFADIVYLKEQSFLHRIRDVCTL